MSEEFKLGLIMEIAVGDVHSLQRSHKNYGNSWRKRGGCGAYMMLARKWDRIENALQPSDEFSDEAAMSKEGARVSRYDIFGAINTDTRPEGIIDDIRDLRRYLLLVETQLKNKIAEVEKDKPQLSVFSDKVSPGLPQNEGEAGPRYTNQDEKPK